MRIRLQSLFLLLACVAVYANGLTGTFTYDDKAIVRDNPRIRSVSRVPEIFSTSYFGGPRGSGSAYRPVLLLSFAVQWWAHGKDALAFHLVNLALHVAATLLLARLLLRVGITPPAAFWAALFFAVLPIHVEAVTSLVGRGETLAAVFVLLFLHEAWTAADRGRSRGRRALAFLLLLAFYALGVLTKESAVVAPGLFFLLLAFTATGRRLRDRLLAALGRGAAVYAGSAAMLAGIFALRRWVLGGLLRAPGWGIFEVENPLAGLGAPERVANALLLLLRYVGRSVAPLFLSADESAWSIRPVAAFSPPALAAAALLVALLLLAVWRLRDGSPVALGILFFLVAFLPTANALYPIGTIFAERVAYLPSAGLCLAAGALVAGEAASFASVGRGRILAASAVAMLFSVRTVIRNPAWWTDWSIFANSLNTAPASAKTHYNWAYVCAEGGRTREAREHYARATAIYDGYWDAWAGKGRMESDLGLTADAEASYRKALVANPAYENGFFGLGLVYEKEERLPQAEATYRQGLAKNPDSLPLAFRLACVLADRDGPPAETDAAFRRALKIGPGSSATHAEYADWLMDEGRADDAQREARRALAIDPRSGVGWRVLARRRGDDDTSLATALAWEKACRGTQDSDDFDELARVAAANAEYRPRFDAIRPELARLVRESS